jgi:hypothetical protein
MVSDSSALHSRWLLLLKIEIFSIVHCCFSLLVSQNELKFLLQLRESLGQMPSDGKSSHGLWPGELKKASFVFNI